MRLMRLMGVLLFSARAFAYTCPDDCVAKINNDYNSCEACCTPLYGTSAFAPCHNNCLNLFNTESNACISSPTSALPNCGLTTATTLPACTTTTTTTVGSSTTTTLAPQFACTEVLGFSQTGQWYLGPPMGTPNGPVFEPLVGDAHWQLRACESAGIQWMDPTYSCWDATVGSGLYSPCANGGGAFDVDRVLLTISIPTGQPTLAQWESYIRAEIATIRIERPNARQIILQPVVGGPNEHICYFGGNPVHATLIHPVIDQAIADVVNDAPDLAAGDDPHVDSCIYYGDNSGHLCAPGWKSCGTIDGRTPTAQEIGSFYANFQ